MGRKPIPTKIRLEIKAYKRMYPKASLSEMADEFEKRIGRKVQRATIMHIIKEDSGLDESRLQMILDKTNDKISQSLASKITRMGMNRQEILAKATDLINRMLDNEESVSVNDAMKVLSETTKIDQVLKGQPSEIHKVVRSIDDETLEFLASLKPNEPNQPIPGEVIPDVTAVTGEFDEVGSNGEGKTSEGGEDTVFCPERETGEIRSS